jgi:hypothetical protein
VQVGSFGFTGGELVVSFGANATQARVNTLLQHIVYWNSSDAPPASVQIDWTFDDGNTGAQGSGGALQATGSTTVSITAVNDAPVIAQLIVNGDFSNGLTGWTTAGTVDVSGGALRFGTGDATGPHSASQTFATVAGQTYTLSFQQRDTSNTLAQSLQVTAIGSGTLLNATVNTTNSSTSYSARTYTFVADSSVHHADLHRHLGDVGGRGPADRQRQRHVTPGHDADHRGRSQQCRPDGGRHPGLGRH